MTYVMWLILLILSTTIHCHQLGKLNAMVNPQLSKENQLVSNYRSQTHIRNKGKYKAGFSHLKGVKELRRRSISAICEIEGPRKVKKKTKSKELEAEEGKAHAQAKENEAAEGSQSTGI